MGELVIHSPHGRDVTTSLIVAQVFGKEHSKVCRDIETLSCSDSFRVANFGVSSYRSLQNKELPMYEMTKDGFSFLVMGYTGKKAGEFKEMFISEFNKREMMLKSDDYILARSQEILQSRLQLAEQRVQALEAETAHQSETIRRLAPKAEYTDQVLQSTSTFTLTQVAHSLGMRSVHVLTKLLSEQGILYKQSGQWQPTAKYAELGYFETRTAKFVKQDGTIGTSLSTVITERGRVFLRQVADSRTAQKVLAL